MAHYALLSPDNIVTCVIAGPDESEDVNLEQVYQQLTGQVCKRTSYNTVAGEHLQGGTAFRKNFAGLGFSYSHNLDAFIPPKPFNSWRLNTDTCTWVAPLPMPADDWVYAWNEEELRWEPKGPLDAEAALSPA